MQRKRETERFGLSPAPLHLADTAAETLQQGKRWGVMGQHHTAHAEISGVRARRSPGQAHRSPAFAFQLLQSLNLTDLHFTLGCS